MESDDDDVRALLGLNESESEGSAADISEGRKRRRARGEDEEPPPRHQRLQQQQQTQQTPPPSSARDAGLGAVLEVMEAGHAGAGSSRAPDFFAAMAATSAPLAGTRASRALVTTSRQPAATGTVAEGRMDEERGAAAGGAGGGTAAGAAPASEMSRSTAAQVGIMQAKMREKIEEIKGQMRRGEIDAALARSARLIDWANKVMGDARLTELAQAIDRELLALHAIRTAAQARAAAGTDRQSAAEARGVAVEEEEAAPAGTAAVPSPGAAEAPDATGVGGERARAPSVTASSSAAVAGDALASASAEARADARAQSVRFAMPLESAAVYLASAKHYRTDNDSVLCGPVVISPESSRTHIDGTAQLEGSQTSVAPRLVGSQCALVRGADEATVVQVTRWVFPRVRPVPAFDLALGALRVMRRDVAESVAGSGGRGGALTLSELGRAARRRSTAGAAFDYSYAGLYVGPASRPPRVLTARSLAYPQMLKYRQLLLSTARPSMMRASSGAYAGSQAAPGARIGEVEYCAKMLRVAHRKDWDESRREACEVASKPVSDPKDGSRYAYAGQRWLAESHSQITRPGAMGGPSEGRGGGGAGAAGPAAASVAIGPRSGPSAIQQSSASLDVKAVAGVVSQSQARGVTLATYSGAVGADEPDTDPRMDQVYRDASAAESHDRDATRDVLFASQGLRAGSRVLLGGTLELLSPLEAFKVAAELRDPLTWQVQDADAWPMPMRVVNDARALQVVTAAQAGVVPVLNCSPGRRAAIAALPSNVTPSSSGSSPVPGASAVPAIAVGTHGLAMQAFVPDARIGELPNVRLGTALDASPILARGEKVRRNWTKVPENVEVRDWMLSVVHLPRPWTSGAPAIVAQRGALYALATLPLERAADLLTAESLKECTWRVTEALKAEVAHADGDAALGNVAVLTLRRDTENPEDDGAEALGTLGFSFAEAIADIGEHQELLQARGPLAPRPQGMADFLDVAPIATLGLSPVLDMKPFPAHGTIDVTPACPPGDSRPAAPKYLSWWDALVRHPSMAPTFVARANPGEDAVNAMFGTPRSTYARVARYMKDKQNEYRSAREQGREDPSLRPMRRSKLARTILIDAASVSSGLPADQIAAITKRTKRVLSGLEETVESAEAKRMVKRISFLSNCTRVLPQPMEQWTPITQQQIRGAHRRVYELMSLIRQLAFCNVDPTTHEKAVV